MIYVARCPECDSMVVAMSDQMPKRDLAKSVADVVRRGLILGTIESKEQLDLNPHVDGCSLGGTKKSKRKKEATDAADDS